MEQRLGGILRSFLCFRFEATLQDKTGHHVSDSDVPQGSFEEWTSWVSPEINSTCRVHTHCPVSEPSVPRAPVGRPLIATMSTLRFVSCMYPRIARHL